MEILQESTDLGQETPGGSTLLGRAQAGDRDAFAELVSGFYPSLLHVARRVLRNEADAEEAVQEAMLKAYQHIAAYRGEAAISTWLIRILMNQAFMSLRRKRRPSVALEDVHVETHRFCAFWGADGKTPEEICASRQNEELLRRCMDRMRPKHRLVLSMRALDDKTYEEIAGELAISVETVRVRLHRARRELRQILLRRLRHRAPQETTGERFPAPAAAGLSTAGGTGRPVSALRG